MADEPEDVEEMQHGAPGPQPTARQLQSYASFLGYFRDRSLLAAEQAEAVFVLVLCALKHHLIENAPDDLRAQLPLKLQGALQACSSRDARDQPAPDAAGLVQRVSDKLGEDMALAESVTRMVFATLRAQLTESEAEQVGDALPLDLRALWARVI